MRGIPKLGDVATPSIKVTSGTQVCGQPTQNIRFLLVCFSHCFKDTGLRQDKDTGIREENLS